MPDGAPREASRESWSREHRTRVYWFEKGFAALALLVSFFAVPRYEGVAQYFFVGVGSIGAWKMFPSVRPFISWLVRKIPFLKNGSGPPLTMGTMEMPVLPPKDDDEAL